MKTSRFQRGHRNVETTRDEKVNAATPRSSGSKPAAVLLVALAVFVLLQCFVPLRTAVQIGADEGFELAKATLCLNGYQLYTEVWNDQPPLHTFLITQVLKHFSSI